MANPDPKRRDAPGDGTPVSLPALPPRSEPSRRLSPGRRAWLAAASLLLLHLAQPRTWGLEGNPLWLPPFGLGVALTAWLGPWAALLVAADTFLVAELARAPAVAPLYPLAEALLLAAEVCAGWWLFRRGAGGSRRLTDPRSAVAFLVLVPGAAAAIGAFLLALVRQALGASAANLAADAATLWLAHALGALVLTPPLLVLLTPWLVRHGLAAADPTDRQPELGTPPAWTTGHLIEVGGLTAGAALLGITLAIVHARDQTMTWPLWALLLLLIVWTSLRHGLAGGSLAAAAASVLGLVTAEVLQVGPGHRGALQGHLLTQCTTALLVGASAGWIRASEARYRQFVGHMPVVLYSARFLHPRDRGTLRGAEVTLVSAASRHILGCPPEDLLGDFRAWLARIHPDDHELMAAAVAQLTRQREPVTCEYRLARNGGSLPTGDKWLRDTLAPHYGADGALEGWEGVVEDITEQRVLASDLHRTTNMLQALVTNLPTGVYFVHGPTGQPLFVNARARQLLGQREDPVAGLAHLPRVYRLHRADGSPYPWEELPVSKALHQGVSAMRDDVVVHRPDGRRVPLITWAAPVDLGGQGRVDGAVWVLEDLTALRQAEAAHREAEARLRATIQAMAEGLVLQNPAGGVVEWNPAACAILGVPPERMPALTALGPEEGCLREDGSLLPPEEHPDRVSRLTGKPVRDVVMGIPHPSGEIRWILVNTMPLAGVEGQRARVVTTFADVTAQRRAAEVLRRSEEQYRGLVEHLPLMVLQLDCARRVVFLNPAAESATGHAAAALTAPGFWQGLIRPDDLPAVEALLAQAEAGRSARGEFRYRARDGSEKVGHALAQPSDAAAGGVTLLVVDMTQQRRLELELQRVQRLELVGRLAGGIVHDVNNLLTVVLSLAELAGMSLPEGHPAAADLDKILRAAEQAAQLIGQLLAFSKERRVAPRRVDVNAVVRRNLDLLHGSLPKGVVVEAALAPGEVWALADETQVQQVLMNLCFNARDAMPAGGRLTVATAAEPEDAVGRNGGAWVRLTVTDTGHGMADEVRARIFDLFFTTKERGSGLGLAVVKQIVEGFGGRIEVASRPGEGTRFDVWLPGAVASGR